MSTFALSALAAVAVVLLLGGVVAERRAAAVAASALCAAATLLTLGYLLTGAHPAAWRIPVGLPGVPMTLALDGLAGWFLLPVFGLGAACGAALRDTDIERGAQAIPVLIGGMTFTVLAGDGFSLLLGFEAMSLAAFVLTLAARDDADARSAALLGLGLSIAGGVCLLVAVALLAGGVPGLPFAAVRPHPPAGARAVAVLALTLAGAGATAGLVPLHVWLPRAQAAAPAPAAGLMAGAMTGTALYVVVRLVFDLCGPAQPAWWAVPLLLIGAAGAVLGAFRATIESELQRVLACATIGNVGLIATGFGVALAARATDLTALATLGLAGALLHTLAQAMSQGLLLLGAGAVAHGAGSRTLARLGGLIGRMPVTTAAMLIGAASWAALPPSGGFAGAWMLLQAVVAAPRIGGLGFAILACVVVACIALASGLALCAAVRAIGVAFLGRPRSPRAAAASEAPLSVRGALLGLASASAIVGLFPGAVLALAGPALDALLPGRNAGAAQILVLARPPEASGYAPIGVALLLAVSAAVTVAALGRFARSGSVGAAAWDGGFAAPPPWLPFGEPTTQYGDASFAQPLRRSLGTVLLALDGTDPADAYLFRPVMRLRAAISVWLDRWEANTVRRALAVVLAAVCLLLVALATMP
ncbi:MAG: hypothetical protein JOY70_04875 [Acidisphaera sp.]|nr:hypothetical protein [Acidisphaera sp.]